MPLPLLGLLFLVAAEYVGLGIFIPVYNALPIALGLSFLLFLQVVFNNTFGPVMQYKTAKYYLAFVFLTASALVHGLIQSYAINPLKVEVGYLMLMIITFYLVDNKKSVLLYAIMFTVVHVFLVFINLNKLGNARVGSFQASFFLGDGNDFAWSLNVALPIAFYLVFSSKKLIIRLVAIAAIGMILLGIIGTQSRGASLAMVAGFLYYFLFVTKKKSSALLIISIVAGVVVMVAPDNYFNRMETISNYEEDTSAMGRIHAWRTATEMAVDHPLLGVGAGSFNSAYGRDYRKPDDPVRWISTHSVYFKVLAEYGFPGIIIFVLIIFSAIKTNNETVRLLKQKDPGNIQHLLWARCLNWSLIAWGVGAMFLTGVDYPHLYLLVGLSMASHRMATRIKTDSSVEEVKKKPWDEVDSVDHVRPDVFK